MSTATETRHAIDAYGFHKFLPGEKPEGALKWSHYPCRKCGLSKKNRIHKAEGKNVPQATSDGDNVCVKCPSCKGTGTIVFSTDEILKLAGKRTR